MQDAKDNTAATLKGEKTETKTERPLNPEPRTGTPNMENQPPAEKPD